MGGAVNIATKVPTPRNCTHTSPRQEQPCPSPHNLPLKHRDGGSRTDQAEGRAVLQVPSWEPPTSRAVKHSLQTTAHLGPLQGKPPVPSCPVGKRQPWQESIPGGDPGHSAQRQQHPGAQAAS